MTATDGGRDEKLDGDGDDGDDDDDERDQDWDVWVLGVVCRGAVMAEEGLQKVVRLLQSTQCQEK